ncbi:MAG: delta-60 repeat domain-containing protein [Actinomycetota bacterium]|nr:delta-60 repeat domain-containing protein [Actinomycetota bacterium]
MRISFRTIAVGALALATLLTLVPPAAAAVSTGYLDRTFSDDGKVLTDVAGDDTGEAVAVQADRKIVVAGTTHGGTDIAVVRYNTDGTLDSTFGGDGIVITDVSGDDAAFALAIQDDGRIVVGGFTDDGVSAALVRYHTDGTLDGTFGGGDGIATISAGTGAVFLGIAIQSDDSIVATGMGNFTGFFGGDALLARFDSSGVPDASFGGGDGITTKKIGFGGIVSGIGVQPDGAIVVVGTSLSITGNENVAVLRFDSSGSLDTTFGGDGIVKTDAAAGPDAGSDVALMSDGSIVAIGSSSYEYGLLVGYNADGTLNSGFGTGGIVQTELGGYGGGFTAGTVQPDDRIVAVGEGAGDASEGADGFLTARYTTTGALDPTFGGDGTVFTAFTTNPFGGASTTPTGVAIAPGGKIVVAGSNYDDTNSSDIAVVRYGNRATAVRGRPDLLVGQRGAFVGDGIYNHTGYQQTITRKVARGRSATFAITIQNDGNALDTIRVVSGARRLRGIRLSFFDHGVPIPDFEWSFIGHPEELAVGASTTIKMVVSVTSKATPGKVVKIPVTGTSSNESTRSDTVAARIRIT